MAHQHSINNFFIVSSARISNHTTTHNKDEKQAVSEQV